MFHRLEEDRMISAVLLAVVNASIFSLGGVGEDVSIFREPFFPTTRLAQIEFTMQPEFNILTEDSDFRGLFRTNPFNFRIAVPVVKGIIFGVGNCERFSQSFDIYSQRSSLELHVMGDGGVEEAYLDVGWHFGIGQVALRGSYLFGNACEVWNYYIGDYSIADTFLYKYSGRIFCGGIKIKPLFLSYEAGGELVMEDTDRDTTIGLAERLLVGVSSPPIADIRITAAFEHSFWDGDDHTSPNRFKLTFAKKVYAFDYYFNPWYLEGVTEHGFSFLLKLPIHRVGLITFDLKTSLRKKGSLKEIKFIPEIKLSIRELFAKRKK